MTSREIDFSSAAPDVSAELYDLPRSKARSEETGGDDDDELYDLPKSKPSLPAKQNGGGGVMGDVTDDVYDVPKSKPTTLNTDATEDMYDLPKSKPKLPEKSESLRRRTELQEPEQYSALPMAHPPRNDSTQQNQQQQQQHQALSEDVYNVPRDTPVVAPKRPPPREVE